MHRWNPWVIGFIALVLYITALGAFTAYYPPKPRCHCSEQVHG